MWLKNLFLRPRPEQQMDAATNKKRKTKEAKDVVKRTGSAKPTKIKDAESAADVGTDSEVKPAKKRKTKDDAKRSRKHSENNNHLKPPKEDVQDDESGSDSGSKKPKKTAIEKNKIKQQKEAAAKIAKLADHRNYLVTYARHRAVWKFSTIKQSWIFENLYELPDEWDPDLLVYLKGLPPSSARDRLVDAAQTVLKDSSEESVKKADRARLVLNAFGISSSLEEADDDASSVSSEESSVSSSSSHSSSAESSSSGT